MDTLIEKQQLILDIFLHLDEYLIDIIANYGIWTYAILFLIIFMETGFVITPFLPGDSLLFAVGTLAALGSLNIFSVFVLLFIAAVLGDTLNYWIGNRIGPSIFKKDSKYIKKEYLIKTQDFYKKHGGKTIVLARFLPIIRTFAPFVAGIGTMSYAHFIVYNVVGGFLWVALFTFGGYWFGNIPAVKENFETVIVAIIVISVIPIIFEAIKHKFKKEKKVN